MMRVGFVGWRGMVGSVLVQRMLEEKDFDLIDPCGMPGVVVTSIANELGQTAQPPSTSSVQAAAAVFARALAERLGTAIAG